MPREPRSYVPIDAVLDRTDLRALLDEFADPAGSANRPKWHCPVSDHDDRDASVTMYRDGRGHERWRCWSGDDSHRGDAIDLVQVVRSCDRSVALEWLAGRAGIRADAPLPPGPTKRRSPPPAVPAVLDDAVKQYVTACERVFRTGAGRPVREWLGERGLGQEVLAANRVGADPGRRLMPRVKGLPSGVVPAATFPALDQAGDVAYVQARYLAPPEGRQKYDNPAAYMGANPRMAWTVPVGERRSGLLVVCEGIPDALTAAQAGCPAVGVLGAQLPDPSVATRLVTRAERDGLTLVAVVDADAAGRRWGDRLSELVDAQGSELLVIEPPDDGLDLNGWALLDDEWTAMLPDTVVPGREVTADHLPTPMDALGLD